MDVRKAEFARDALAKRLYGELFAWLVQADIYTELSRWLTHRRIASAHEVIVSRMDVRKAEFARDALAKRLYGELFAWLVQAVNRALDTGHAKRHFIGEWCTL
ncbi:unnamed protein product [Euphydryas editha]|nr:unnamed protein product [Euphydryas editha]CAH2084247.1 unnamed protein product [Euphydryas editha]CAH2084248.1 unnamed protein product [Euphydryas editha]CAH2084249.1 unnamed protein product [Euphydryas editha]CAH2084251.1 unnamed protein product [Euphydryas editha]